jgi:tetratricopeptide (TPR) repeat protein
MADEGAASIPGEGLRSAFAISTEHVLTAWHCVRDASTRGDSLWFRLRVAEAGAPRRYAYLPVRVLAQSEAVDVAVLEVDEARLREDGLPMGEAEKLLARSVIPLGVDVSVHEHVRVMGFPANAPSADSDTLAARVVDLILPLGEVTGLKLVGESFAAVDPVNPRGLSGGPVLKSRPAGTGDEGIEVAVGVIRGVPVGRYPDTALGGGLIATRIEDVAGLVPEIAAALLADVSGGPGPEQRADRSLSGLLRADAEIVDFFGRDRELRELRAWCDEPAEQAAWLVTGTGGQGKTRLARQLCSVLTGSGKWATAMLHGSGDAGAVRDLRRRAVAADRSLLLVADYAAEYGAAAFAELIAILTDDSARLPRWRLLLLARNTGNWWQPQRIVGAPGTAVRLQLLARGVEVPEKELALTPLVPDPHERGAAFHRILAQLRPAIVAYAVAHGMAVADPPVVPDLSAAALGSALMLHVAAVVSLLPPVGRPLKPIMQPSDNDLIDHVLDLEAERHWLYADASAARLYRPTEAAFGDLARGDPTAVETSVAAATLAGAPTAYGATQLVTRALEVDQTRARIIALWLHDLYPAPEASSENAWLPPLQPDRLGEELVARVIRREQADGTPPDQLLPRRILGVGPDSLAAVQLHRLLTMMIRTGARERDIAELIADASGHGGLLGAIRAEIDLTVVEGALPETNTNLLGPAASVTEHVIRHYDVTHAGWRELDPYAESNRPILNEGARLLSRLSSRLLDMGRRDDALAAAEHAAGIHRRLAEVNPAAYLPDLAQSLTNFANGLLRVGRREEALAAADEAVELYRRLAGADPTYRYGLALSLNNIGLMFSEVGRREEALAASNETAELYQRMAEANPAAYLPDLAIALLNLGKDLAEVGRQEEALAAAMEAVERFRRLAGADPGAHLRGLAMSLNNVGVLGRQSGRREEALAPASEAVELYRQLAEANPAAYQPELAGALGNLAALFLQVGRREEALAKANEAVELYRRLAEANPAAYQPDLAMSLTSLGAILHDAGHPEEALARARAAAELYRRLAEANPAAYQPDLARSLGNLGAVLLAAGHPEEALAAAHEAAEILRRLAEAYPAAYLPDLARSLNILAPLILQAGRPEEALAAAHEAVDIDRRLAEANPSAYQPDLARALTNLGGSFNGLGRSEEALAAVIEAGELYRSLSEASSAAYLPDLARTLTNLGIILDGAGRTEEALAPTREAAECYRRLAQANPVAYLPDLARSLADLANGLIDAGRSAEADRAWEETLAELGSESGALRRLRAGWDWVLAPTYEAEHDYLAAHPELLAPESEVQLRQVLGDLPPEEEERYLALLATARVHGIDAAYRDLL